MPMRNSTIKSQEAIADSSTETVDLSKNDWISAILIEYYATNGATNNEDAHPHDMVSSIQVLDGSYVLKSMSGVQAQALYFYDHGVTPPEWLDETLSVVQRSNFAILFGRYVGDPYFAINAKDFENLQLRFVHNIATVRAVGATGYLTTSARFSVTVVRFEDMNLSPLGWFKTEEKKNFVTAAAGIEQTSLPVDHEYRRIMLRSFITNNTFGMTQFDLNMGDGKFKPYDGHLFRWMAAQNKMYYGVPETVQRLYKQDADTYEADIYDTLQGGVRGMATAGDIISLTENYGLVTMALQDDAAAAIVADQISDVQNIGTRYQNTVMIPCDIGGEFLDARKYGSASLDVTQNAVTRAASIVLEEVMRGRGRS